MEKVDDNLVNMDAELMVFSRHGEHLFLRPVAQLALPQAHAIFRKHSRAACRICIIFNDLLRRVGNGQPVVHVLRRFRDPFRVIGAERDTPHGGIVPQETVAKR